MLYSPEQRQAIQTCAIGRTITEVQYVEDHDPPYWVFVFDDGTEISFRFMAELVN